MAKGPQTKTTTTTTTKRWEWRRSKTSRQTNPKLLATFSGDCTPRPVQVVGKNCKSAGGRQDESEQ